VVLHLDDGIVAAEGLDNFNWASQTARQDLTKAGLVAYQQKSQWEPVWKLEWLGFQINLSVGV